MDEEVEATSGADAYRAVRKAERREQRREQAQDAPVTARYGVWTGQGYLREGEGLEKRLAQDSLKVAGASSGRRETRRKRKRKR